MAPAKSTKSPAFQFYPKDFLSSSKVQRMSLTERGAYITLLAHCWLDNGLPIELPKLASIVGLPKQRFERIWTHGPLSECFHERAGRLHNERLDRERKAQTEFRRRQSDAAASRWHMHRESQRNALLSSSSSASAHKKEKEEDCTPVILTFPVTGNAEEPLWPLTQGRIDRWRESFPALDIVGESRKALAWVEANGPKTARGMPAFLVRWFNTAVNRGPTRPILVATGTAGRGRTGAAPRGKYDGIGEE